MKKYLLFYAVAMTALFVFSLRHYRFENRRLTQNQTALTTQIQHYRTRAGQEAASAHILRLRCSEFEELRAADAAHIKSLGIRLRRVEAAATTATQTAIELRAKLCDTRVVRTDSSVVSGNNTPARPILANTLRLFRWHDPWVTVDGTIGCDSIACRIRSVDTLRQVIHRIPHRFLFIRWGTKALRQEIVSSNPHTRIVFSEYVKIEKRGK